MLHRLTIWRGGAERLLFSLSQALLKLGYQVDIYVLKDSPNQCYPELREGLKVKATQGITYKNVFSAVPIVQALEMIREIAEDYDIIHAHNFPSHIAATFLSSKMGNVPFVWQCNEPHRILHDEVERGSYIRQAIKSSFLSRIMRLGALQVLRYSTKTIDRMAARRAFAITALSNYESRVLEALYDTKPIVIPPGVDRSKFDQKTDAIRIRNEFGIGDAPLILTVSRLWPTKNLENALIAFRLVLRRLPSAFYMIVGDGPSKSDLHELSKTLGVNSRCIFVSDQAIGDRINLFYAACDAYLFTSLGEPWGLTVLEAMQMKKPIVASADGGVLDLIQDHSNGILVNPLDPSEVATRLIEALTDHSLASKLGTAAVATASKYTWRRMAGAYNALYQDAIS